MCDLLFLAAFFCGFTKIYFHMDYTINIPCSQEKWDPTSCIWTTPQPETRNIQRGYISTLVFNKMSSATMI